MVLKSRKREVYFADQIVMPDRGMLKWRLASQVGVNGFGGSDITCYFDARNDGGLDGAVQLSSVLDGAAGFINATTSNTREIRRRRRSTALIRRISCPGLVTVITRPRNWRVSVFAAAVRVTSSV